MLGFAVGGASLPRPSDPLSELLVGLQPLPLAARAPVLAAAPRPALRRGAPQLTAGFAQPVSRRPPFLGSAPRPQGRLAFQGPVLPAREPHGLLALAVAAVFPAAPAVCGFASRIEPRAPVAHDGELVKPDRRLRGLGHGGGAKRLPHVPHRQPEAVGLGCPEPRVELLQAFLRPVLTPAPDRPATAQVADHDPLGGARAERALVTADGLRPRRACTGKLSTQVLLVHLFARIPVAGKLLSEVLDRRCATAPTHVISKACGVEQVVRQKIPLLAFPRAAAAAGHPPHCELEVEAQGAAAKSAALPPAAVVPTRAHPAAAAPGGFFERRSRVMTRAGGSPKTPRTVGCGRNPGKGYASQSRRFRFAEVPIAT